MITLICGRLGCGKTTYADALPAPNISLDRVMLARYPHYLGSDHERIASITKAELLEKAAAIGEAVLDWGFFSRRDRIEARAYFEARGISTQLIWLDPPEAVILARRAYRNAHRPEDAYFIDENLARKCDAMFEPPLPGEYDIKINDQEK